MSDWYEAALGDFIHVKHGYAFGGSGITTEERPQVLVTPGNFSIGGGFKSEKFKYFDGDYPDDYVLREGDIVVTMTDLSKEGDTLGYGAKIPKATGRVYLHNQRIGRVQLLTEDIDKDFLYWVLRTPQYQGFIVGAATGTAVRHTSPSTIMKYRWRLPVSTGEQKSIASVLSNLDDKVNLLQGQNKTLDAIAETLFRQWFVEEMEDNCSEYRVGDLVGHLKGSVIPDKFPDRIFHHYSLPAFDAGSGPTNEVGSQILSNKFSVEPWTILVSKLNPRFPRIWAIGELVDGDSICSTEFQVLKPRQGLYGYVYFLLRSDEAKDELTMAASGTSGSHQRVRPEDILNIRARLPSMDLAEKYSALVMPHIEKVWRNTGQIHLLEQLRDTLLPKLMSGEVRVAY